MSSGGTPSDLNAMARRVIDSNHYMTLGTEGVAAEACRTSAGATRLTPDGLRRARLTPDDLRRSDLALYVAHMQSCEVHVPGNHPVHRRVTDTRQPADPTSPAA